MPLLSSPLGLAGVVVAGDHEVAPREARASGRARRVTASRAPGASRAACERLAGAQQRLGRDACPVVALAADQLALDDRDPQAAVGEAGRRSARRRARRR